MAGTSFMNLMCHIAAVSFCHFIPVEESWPQPKEISQGAQDFIRIIERVLKTGIGITILSDLQTPLLKLDIDKLRF